QQGSTLSSQGAAITSLTGQLTYGSNLVPNPQMQNNAAGWSAVSSGIDSVRSYVQSNSAYAPSSAYFAVIEGQVLVVTADLWINVSTPIMIRFRFDGPNLSNNAFAVFVENSPVINTWFQGVGKATVPSGATSAQIQIYHGSGNARLSNPLVYVQTASADALQSLGNKV
ncbi:hypothetical protein, partial [Tatumella sp. JGM82]